MPTTWSGYLDDVSATFDTGVNNLQQDVTKALEDLAKTLRSSIAGGVSE